MKDLLGLSAVVFSATLLIPTASAYAPGVAPAATSCSYVATAPYSVTVSWAADAGRPKAWTLLARDGILGVTPAVASGRVSGSAGSIGYETYAVATDPSNTNIVLSNRNGFSADLACTATVAADAPVAPVETVTAPVEVLAAPAETVAAPAVVDAAPVEVAAAPIEAQTGQ